MDMTATAIGVPIIGVTSCNRPFDGAPYHAVGHGFVAAIATVAGGVPLIVPSMQPPRQTTGGPIDALVRCLDGLLVTGSKSHIDPAHYGETAATTDHVHDPDRDATTLPLIRAAIAAELPLLAICRGIQEVNVAFGGSLHQQVQEIAGMHDHRGPDTADLDARHAPRHALNLAQGSHLARLARRAGVDTDTLIVNSLHEQAIDRLAPNLVVEATAEDGVVEAVRVEGARAFAIGVQWHPEYQPQKNNFSSLIFDAFGAACRERAEKRIGHSATRPGGGEVGSM